MGELMIAAAARVGGDLGAAQLRKLQVLGQPAAAKFITQPFELFQDCCNGDCAASVTYDGA